MWDVSYVRNFSKHEGMIDPIEGTSWLLSDAAKIGGPSPTLMESICDVISLLVLFSTISLEKRMHTKWGINNVCNVFIVYLPKDFFWCGIFQP